MRIAGLILITILITVACSQSQESLTLQDPVFQEIRTEELTEHEAIRFAEEFIVQNGYTDLPPDKDSITKEPIEWEPDLGEMLRTRHDTLQPKAYGLSRGRKNGSAGWTVVFAYKNLSEKWIRKNGRAVTMNLDGSDARVEHVDFILAKVDKKL